MRTLFITFDDGPVPKATPFALKELEKVGGKATFFCVGENAVRYPDLVEALTDAGHRLGNHTHNHLDCWKTPSASYLRNVDECSKVVDSNLFRPPYGHLTSKTLNELKTRYRIVFWDVLTYDFDASFDSNLLIRNCIRSVQPGSIVVFHDSVKALPQLKRVLPELLMRWQADGYTFLTL